MSALVERLGEAVVVQVSARRYQVAIAYTIVDGAILFGFDGPAFKNRATAVSRANEINALGGRK